MLLRVGFIKLRKRSAGRHAFEAFQLLVAAAHDRFERGLGVLLAGPDLFELFVHDRTDVGQVLNQQANTSGSTPAKKAASFEVAYFLM